jgi:hypothetical protein
LLNVAYIGLPGRLLAVITFDAVLAEATAATRLPETVRPW